jgi:hypothetical protein
MVDDAPYIITKKAEWIESRSTQSTKIEDYEIVFETDFHRFTWWEIANETTLLVNTKQWQLGENTLAFLRLEPL